MMALRNFVLPLVLLLASSGRASAQPAVTSPDTDRQLNQLIEEAQALCANLQAVHRAGKPIPKADAERALELSERADSLRSSARTLSFRAMAEQWLGRWGAAEEHFSTALAREDDPYVDSARSFIAAGLATVRGNMGELIITGPPGASVWVKDSYRARTRGILPLKGSIWVSPGPISVQVAAAGYQPYQFPPDGETVRIRAGERRPIIADPVRATLVEIAPLTPNAADAGRGAGGSRWPGWALVGVGAAALAGGLAYGLAGGNPCGTIPQGAVCHEAPSPWLSWGVAGAGAATAGLGWFLLYRANDPEISMAVGPGTLILGGRL
jgi:hypothetical protein